ncbi:MAG: hypothetical protein WB493_15080 [Anaeromyxobacteraceae bacterium]
MRAAIAGLLVPAALLLPAAAGAQAVGPLFPPSIAIANYDRVLVGQEEALEAGAFVARVGDTSSGWYNPAGMALMTRSAITASASGLQADLLSLEGVATQRGGGMSVYQLPSFFGAVLGREVIDAERWRIGFTITKPTSWNQEAVGGFVGDTRLAYSSHVNLAMLVPMFSVSWSPSPALRFGAGIGAAMTSLSGVQSLYEQVPAAATANAFLRTLDASGTSWSLTGTLGAQWDVTRNLVVGAMLRLPGLEIAQGGRLSYQSVENRGQPWNGTFLVDQDATFHYRLPFDANLGIAWRSRSFEVEADVRFHSAIPEYALFSTANPVQVTTTDPATGLPVYAMQPFPAVTNGAGAVWNLAVGGRYNLDEAWSFHGGFYTDGSPTNASGEVIFRSVDMYGVTLGAKLRGDHLSGSLGLGYSWGSSRPFEFADPVTGTPITSRLTVRSLSLLYAISYAF